MSKNCYRVERKQFLLNWNNIPFLKSISLYEKKLICVRKQSLNALLIENIEIKKSIMFICFPNKS